MSMPLESSRIDDDFTSIRGRVQVQMNHQFLQYPHQSFTEIEHVVWFSWLKNTLQIETGLHL
jgi:hypothetical protein